MGEKKFKNARFANDLDAKESALRNFWELILLNSAQNKILSAVLELHAPTPSFAYTGTANDPYIYLHSECRGCEFEEGYDSGPPNFPCATIRLVATEMGVPVP